MTTHSILKIGGVAAVALMLGGTGALAQSQLDVAAGGECADDAGVALPATQPQPSDDGTAPGNSGSTGWTGGTGGSQIGTNSQGAVPSSVTWHAPTARGLDLQGRPEPADQPQDAPKPASQDLAGLPDC
jgi:hypothetical protein